MSTASAALDRPPLDARPVRSVSGDTAWDDAIARRDRFAAVFRRVLGDEGVEALVLTSQNGNYPAWVRLEAWLPDRSRRVDARRRCELELIVEARPLNRHPVLCTARLTRGGKAIALAERARFTEHDAGQWARHAIERGPRPENYRPGLDALREMLGTLIPPLRPTYNPIARKFRTALVDKGTVLAALTFGAIAAGVIYRDLLGPVALAVGGATVLGIALLAVLPVRYRRRDWVTAQPVELPRHLGMVDSWHAALENLGDSADEMMRRLLERLAGCAASGFVTRRERYGHRTGNGYDERERIVVSRGQGQLHVHLYAVGSDLFVGWQAYLNWAQWAETEPVASRESGASRVEYRDVTPGWYIPQQFDLIDLDSLTAVVHRAIELEVTTLLRDRAIDQEIDFEITRGNRDRALDRREAWPERSPERVRDSGRIFGATAVRRASAGEMRLAPADARPAARRGGLARIPPVLLLPLVAAAGYAWLYNAGAVTSWRIDDVIAPGFRFTFLPLFPLPLAVALGLGIWLQADVRPAHAGLTSVLIVALNLCTSYAYTFVFSRIAPPVDPGDTLQIGLYAGLAALPVGVSCLASLAVWTPKLRARRYWISGLVLWMLWSALASLLAREMQLAGAAAYAANCSLRVFIPACVGFWLWRPAGFKLALPSLGFRPLRLPARPGATDGVARTAADGKRLVLPQVALGPLCIGLALLAFLGLGTFGLPAGPRPDFESIPSALAISLLAIGILVAVEEFGARGARATRTALALRPLVAATAAAAAFMLAVQPLGIAGAAAAALVVAATAASRLRPLEVVLALVALLVVLLVLAHLTGQAAQLWPSLGGL